MGLQGSRGLHVIGYALNFPPSHRFFQSRLVAPGGGSAFASAAGEGCVYSGACPVCSHVWLSIARKGIQTTQIGGSESGAFGSEG